MSRMHTLSQSFAGLFKPVPRLSFAQQEDIEKMLTITDRNKLLDFEKETNILASIHEDLESLTGDEEHLDQATIDRVLEHFRKYTDTSTEQEVIDNFIDERINGTFTGSPRHEEERYRPELYNKKLPSYGGWVMVIADIPVGAEFRPSKYSVYYAKPNPVYTELQLESTARRKGKLIKIPYYKVSISTLKGKVDLWPHEYMYIKDVKDITAEVGNSFDIVRMGGSTNYDNAKVHYLSTRGIDSSGVYELLLGAINSLDFLFFEIRENAFPFWDHFITCISLGASPRMAIMEWEMLQAGMTHYPITIKRQQNEDTDKVRKSRPKTNIKRVLHKSAGRKSNSASRSKR